MPLHDFLKRSLRQGVQPSFEGCKKTVVRHLVRGLDLILPPQSLIRANLAFKTQTLGAQVFGAETSETQNLAAWSALRFLDAPCCDLCGFPFEFDMGGGALCARCIAKPPKCRYIRAALAYDDASRQMVLDFKHGGRTEGLSMFGMQMARAGRKFLPEADLIIPVPLHYRRLVKRRYNQSALLSRALVHHIPARFDADILQRHKITETQGGKTLAGRRRNVNGAFRVRPKALDRVQGARIVLVDDVLTTGATLDSCAKVLLKAGAVCVDGLTLARVVRGTAFPT